MTKLVSVRDESIQMIKSSYNIKNTKQRMEFNSERILTPSYSRPSHFKSFYS